MSAIADAYICSSVLQRSQVFGKYVDKLRLTQYHTHKNVYDIVSSEDKYRKRRCSYAKAMAMPNLKTTRDNFDLYYR